MSKLYGRVSKGKWSLSSEKDYRFNCYSEGMVGWLHIPYEAISKIKEFELEYNVEAPDDLVLSYVKN